MFVRILFVILVALLTACASHPQVANFKPVASNEKAVIYHYRKSQFAGGGRNFHITNNGQPAFVMENGSFYKELVNPGRVTYRSKSLQKHIIGNLGVSLVMNNFEEFEERLTLDVKANEVYFVEWSHGKAEIRDENAALGVINGLSDLTGQF